MPAKNSPEKLRREIEEIHVLEREYPRAVINLLPEEMANKIAEHANKHPEWFNVPEGELRTLLRQYQEKPSRIDNVLRMKFWLEYDRVLSFGLKKMHLPNVTAGAVVHRYFTSWYPKSASRMAWMLCPPLNYLTGLEEMHYSNLETLSELTSLPVVDAHGEVDYKLATLKINLFKAIDERLHGSVIQRHQIDQRIQQRVEAVPGPTIKDIVGRIEGDNVEALEARLKQLEVCVANPSYSRSGDSPLVMIPSKKDDSSD